jgi:hypothetical protein
MAIGAQCLSGMVVGEQKEDVWLLIGGKSRTRNQLEQTVNEESHEAESFGKSLDERRDRIENP